MRSSTGPAQIAAANETAPSFTYENNQPLAAIIANGGVGLLRAEIALQLVDMVLVGIQPLGLCHFETFSSAPRNTLRNHPYNNVRFIA